MKMRTSKREGTFHIVMANGSKGKRSARNVLSKDEGKSYTTEIKTEALEKTRIHLFLKCINLKLLSK